MQNEIRYQVFVSSTFLDLKEEREKALQAILQLRAFPAGMELFPAADDEQFEFIKREIDSSDYYVVIIGGKYGSVDDSGVSFTEKEFNYAQTIGKPILAFIVRDLRKLTGEKLDLSEELIRKLEAFTEKAKRGRLVNFFSNPDELKSAILVSLTTQFNLRPMRGWVRAGLTSRDDLERISFLQQSVLDLERENHALKRGKRDLEDRLQSGSAEISWNLNLSDFQLGQNWPASREITLTSTWNELLRTIFSRGSSFTNELELRRNLLKWISRSMEFKASQDWFNQLSAFESNPHWAPKTSSIEMLVTDLHRQFTGLGLIYESQDTIHIPQQFGGGQIAKTLSVWKLTEKGEQQLALLGGYLKSDEVAS